MRGLFAKIGYETWLPTLLFGLSLLIVNALLTFILPQTQQALDGVLGQIPLAKTLLTALLGTEVGDEISARTMQAFLWVHPVVLSLVWAHEITLCTRFPAGEIDRGTIDILLSFPVSRRQIYWCESAVCLLTGLVILALGLVGHRLAAPAMPADMRPELSRASLVIFNLYCVYLAIGGISFLVSSLSDRRGRAIAVVFAIVLISFLLNFIAQFWEPAKRFAHLSVMTYYQPALILRSGEIPSTNIAVLIAIGTLTWLVAGEVNRRRSICTV